MADIKGFRGGSVPPVKDGDVDAFHDFIRWLEDHNYCKVTRCRDCWFWADGRTDREYRCTSARCRRHKVDTYHDDFCSDAVEIRRDDNELPR